MVLPGRNMKRQEEEDAESPGPVLLFSLLPNTVIELLNNAIWQEKVKESYKLEGI